MNINIIPVHIVSGLIYEVKNEMDKEDNFNYYKVKNSNDVEDINLSQNIIGKIRYKGVLTMPKKSKILNTN